MFWLIYLHLIKNLKFEAKAKFNWSHLSQVQILRNLLCISKIKPNDKANRSLTLWQSRIFLLRHKNKHREEESSKHKIFESFRENRDTLQAKLVINLSGSAGGNWPWTGAKRSRARLTDLRLSFFSDCGSTSVFKASIVISLTRLGFLHEQSQSERERRR